MKMNYLYRAHRHIFSARSGHGCSHKNIAEPTNIRLCGMMRMAFANLLLVLLLTNAWVAHAQTTKKPEIGDILCTDGTFVAPHQWSAATSKTAKAVVFYVNSKNPTKGLAVALKDLGRYQWSTNVKEDVAALPNKMRDDLSGRANTKALRAMPAADYPAAHAISAADWAAGWYVPSAGELRLLYAQYSRVVAALGYIETRNRGTTSVLNDVYWSSTENGTSSAMIVTHYDRAYAGPYIKTYSWWVRPVLAFY